MGYHGRPNNVVDTVNSYGFGKESIVDWADDFNTSLVRHPGLPAIKCRSLTAQILTFIIVQRKQKLARS